MAEESNDDRGEEEEQRDGQKLINGKLARGRRAKSEQQERSPEEQ